MDKRWYFLIFTLVLIVAVLIYFSTPAQQPIKTGIEPSGPNPILVLDKYVNSSAVNISLSIARNPTELILCIFSNDSSGTISVLDPQGHMVMEEAVTQGNDSNYKDVAFQDPPYVVLNSGEWHFNAILKNVKSVHVMIYAQF